MRTAVILLYTCWTAGVCVSSVQAKVLNGIVGQSVTFPTTVKGIGYFLKNSSRLAKVDSGGIHLSTDSYGARLQWDSSSGHFSLTDLRASDSGDYSIQHKDGTLNAYKLNVWDPVPRPQVSSRNKMKPGCSVQCSVENGREVTLAWHREGQTLSHTSSLNLSTRLSLPLEIEENSAPYSCVAANAVSNKSVIVKSEEHCFESVLKPHIQTAAAEGGRSCSLQCSVQNGREVTLSWRTEGQTLSHTSSLRLSTPLSLTLEIEVSNLTYTCVAGNPVSEETTAFHPTQVCGPGRCSLDAVLYIMLVLRLLEFVLVTVAFLALAVVLLIRLYKALSQRSPDRRGRRRHQEAETVL